MFGKLYGGGVGSPQKPGRMTKLLQMPFAEAKAFIDGFEKQFEAVKQFMDSAQRDAKRAGEAYNTYGRRYALGQEWAYKVVNYLVQGTCADLLKTAMLRVAWLLKTRWHIIPSKPIHILNSAHDEIDIEVPLELHSHQLMREIIWVMQMDSAFVGIPVPLPVGIKVVEKRWSHPREIELEPWVKGGIVRDRHAIEAFREVQAVMRSCPYHEDGALPLVLDSAGTGENLPTYAGITNPY
jgi:DNA polymerase-1